jgi:rhodanese-related sulfurtransferase
MIFEQIVSGGCQSYLVGCDESCAAAVIDPEISQMDRYLALAARDGLRIRYVVDTHTHADHFSATKALAELHTRAEAADGDLIVLDVRERDAYEGGHIPGAQLLPRGQLELRINQALPDPTRRVLAYCELGLISTLAAKTLREMGFQRAVALDGGMKAWREAGYAVKSGKEP